MRCSYKRKNEYNNVVASNTNIEKYIKHWKTAVSLGTEHKLFQHRGPIDPQTKTYNNYYVQITESREIINSTHCMKFSSHYSSWSMKYRSNIYD